MAVNIDKVIKLALKTATGHEVYALEKPKSATHPCLVYRLVSEKNYIHAEGKTNVVRARFQITCLASSYSVLKTMVSNVKGVMIGKFDKYVSIPSETIFEAKDENGIYVNNSDYFVFYKPN